MSHPYRRQESRDSRRGSARPPRQPNASSSGSRSGPISGPNSRHPNDSRRAMAQHTRQVLPTILPNIPNITPDFAKLYQLDDNAKHLDPAACPRNAPIRVSVVNSDTLNCAINLAQNHPSAGRVAIFNFANARVPGGGWLRGARAQEEEIFYRSSLSTSLTKNMYPIPRIPVSGLYTPDMVVIKADASRGYQLLDPGTNGADLPIMSAISIAAIRDPPLRNVLAAGLGPGAGARTRPAFANAADREVTKGKMRLCLRMAAINGHELLVLGAFGCGAFHNPRDEIVLMWQEVLHEAEFKGGWWQAVVFAVLDSVGGPNISAFATGLDGLVLGRP